MLECSLFKALWSERKLSLANKKIKEITTKFKKAVSIALSEPQLVENSDCSNCWRLLDSVKKKIKNCSNGRKYKCLFQSLKVEQLKK